MEDLLKLEANSPAVLPHLPTRALEIVTLLRVEAWHSHLHHFPDKRFSRFILRGLREGFRIGFESLHPYRSSNRNLKSAHEHPTAVQTYLDREASLRRIFPLTQEEARAEQRIQISPFGVIPKRGKPVKWRLIIDLLSPTGRSVNDGVTQELCSISYTSVDEAVKLVQRLGRGTLLAKMDLKEAYRAIPVHPADRPLLSVQWQGTIFVDGALPFGLRSAPKLFSALADGLLWIFLQGGVQQAIHYLDDFLFLGPPSSQVCTESLHTALRLCEALGVLVAPEKTEGPASVITFLGIEIDTVAGELRLPAEKLQNLQQILLSWMQSSRPSAPKSTGTKRELLSLIGLLHHASKVVQPGRAFIRNLINASTTVSSLDHHVSLRADPRADVAWWNTFLSVWNGVSLMHPANTDTTIISDASGSWGCGAICDGRWFQLAWPGEWKDIHISPKELVPIVLAVALWGPLWAGKKIGCRCDNMAVVYAVNKGAARNPQLTRLLRVLGFLCGVHSISLTAQHIAGVRNVAADALSRNQLSVFFASCPQAVPIPSGVPLCLQELVLDQSLRWTSPSWKQRFITMLTTVSQLLPSCPMPPPNVVTSPSAQLQA